VLFLIDTLRRGGAEQLILTTVRHLDRSHFEPEVIAMAPPLDLKREIEAAGVRVQVVGARRLLDAGALARLVRMLRGARPTIVHTHLRQANLYGRLAARLADVPVVVTSFHCADYTHWPPRTLGGTLWKMLDRWSARRVNGGFLAVSDAVRADYAKHFALPDIKVVHNYIDIVPRDPPDPAARRATRADVGCSDDDVVILNVGRLSWEKGQADLIEAMPEVLDRAPRAQVWLAGEGPEGPALEARARTLGVAERVRLLGPTHDVGALLRAADLFAFPSVAEGLGIALLEAMAAGLPVVAASADGIPEVVTHEVDGLLLPPRDPKALAGALLRLLRDSGLCLTLANEATRTVRARFEASVGVRALETAYREFLAHEPMSGMRAARVHS
jgi:glycosyltransferase involved in cell wall biosynthesis